MITDWPPSSTCPSCGVFLVAQGPTAMITGGAIYVTLNSTAITAAVPEPALRLRPPRYRPPLVQERVLRLRPPAQPDRRRRAGGARPRERRDR